MKMTQYPQKNKRGLFWMALGIILIFIIIIETLIIIWAIQLGNHELEQEEKCAWDICADYPSYSYEEGLCECYKEDILEKTEFIG